MTTHSTRRRLRAVAALSLASALLLAGCGNDDPDPDNGPDTSSQDETVEPGDDASAAGDEASPGSQFEDEVDVSTVGTTPTESVFNVESPWNVAVRDAAVHPASESLLENTRFRQLPGFDGTETNAERITEGVYINTDAWTVPVVADGAPTLLTCRQVTCGDGDEDITLDIPTDVDPDPLYDGWFTIFEPSTRTAYDLWRARREDDGSISYHFMRTWNLDGPGFNQPYLVGARGSGLPLFAGLIRPGELERGQINHALAISLPGPAADYFVQPASSTDGNNNREGALPEGARIRLRADFELERPFDEDTNRFLPFRPAQAEYAQRVVDALKRYGAILVDRAAVPTLYFQRVDLERGREPLLYGWELKSIDMADFEVIDFRSQERFPFPPNDTTVDPADALNNTVTASSTGTSTDESEDER
jgi:hypothetical protein